MRALVGQLDSRHGFAFRSSWGPAASVWWNTTAGTGRGIVGRVMKHPLRPAEWPLPAKLIGLLATALVIPLVVSAAIDIQRTRGHLIDSTERLLEARADQIASALDNRNRGYALSIGRMARLPGTAAYCSAEPGRRAAPLAALMDVISVYPGSDAEVRAAGIIDAGGRVVAATEPAVVGTDLSAQPHVRAALGGAAAISDPYFELPDAGEAQTIAYLAPVFDTGHRVICIVALWTRGSSLRDYIKTFHALGGTGSSAVIFDRLGIRIAHSLSDDVVGHPAGPLATATIASLVAARRFGAGTGPLLEDVRPAPENFERARADAPNRAMFKAVAQATQRPSYSVARRLETVPWTVVYQVPAAEFEAKMAQATRERAFEAAAVVTVASLIGLVFARGLVSSVRALGRATTAIAAGDFGARAPTLGGDELGQLAESFNTMADRIETQARTIEQARAELERRVDERTRQLRVANLALQSSEQRFRETFDVSPVGMLLARSSGEIVLANVRMAAMTGYMVPELIGQPVEMLVPERYRAAHPSHRAAFGASGATRPVGTHRDLFARRKDGGELPVDIGLSTVWTPDGRMLLANVVDMTERKRLEAEVRQRTAELERSNAELEQFANVASHDLREPLRTIAGMLGLLQQRYAGRLDEKADVFIGHAVSGAGQMRRLIDDLLTYSRAGRREAAFKPVDCGALLGQVLRGLSAAVDESGAKVSWESLPVIDADRTELFQLFQNLVGNAIKFHDQGRPPEVTISARRVDDGASGAGTWRFAVHDNGIGIPVKYHAEIFEPFRRLHSRREYSGTGIGLALCRRIVERHGGRIWVESEPGRGSTFLFELGRLGRTAGP